MIFYSGLGEGKALCFTTAFRGSCDGRLRAGMAGCGGVWRNVEGYEGACRSVLGENGLFAGGSSTLLKTAIAGA